MHESILALFCKSTHAAAKIFSITGAEIFEEQRLRLSC
jgi:hypothetical protein